MSETVRHIGAGDAPEMVSILLCCLLFKLGGQLSLTMGEIEKIHNEFPSIRFALSELGGEAKDEVITLTIRSREHRDSRQYNVG